MSQGPRSSGFFKFSGNSSELLEDMDTSESEHSQSGEESADEWVHPMFIVKKRNSRKGGRSGTESHSLDTDGDESIKREDSVDVSSAEENSTTAVCCSCSKSSFCKTMKCECRASGGCCSASCGCSANKCSNKEGQKLKERDSGKQPDEVEHERDLASQGATLLQSALAEMPAEQHEEKGAQRKPLADIGNTAVS